MNSRENISIKGESRLMDTTELRAYTNLGKNMATKLGAKIKVGRRTLWDKIKIDQYLNELTGVE